MLALYATFGALPFLFNTNFEYEYTLILTWALGVTLPFCWWLKPKELWTNVGIGYALMFSVAALLFKTTQCPCSFQGFVFWFVFNTLPTFLLGHAFVALTAPWKKRRWIAVFGLLTLLLVLLIELYINPQKRILHPYFGFLHGPIYDEWIPLSTTLILGRMRQVFLGIAILSCVPFRKWMFSTCLIGYMTLPFFYENPEHLSQNDLKQAFVKNDMDELDATWFAQKNFNPENLFAFENELRFHLQDLKKILKLEKYPHVDVYLYANSEEKKLLFGGGESDVTDIYTPSIHLTYRESPHPTLRHELVHALVSGIAFYGLGFHPNMALTEGLAVALAPEERILSIDEQAAYLVKTQQNVEELFSPFFWKESGMRSYTIAGSFLQFLISQYGMENVLKLYAGENFESALDSTSAKEVQRWKTQVLDPIDIQKNAMMNKRYFRSRGVLRDLCPHSLEDLNPTRNQSKVSPLRHSHTLSLEEYETWKQHIRKTSIE